MSLPSFKLSKSGSTWWAEGKLASGRAFRIDCGTGSHDKAEGVAEMKLRAKASAAKGSRVRWDKFYAEKKARASSSSSSGPSSSTPKADPVAAAPERASDDDLRARLLKLGTPPSSSSSSGPSSSTPIEPDEIIPPERDDDQGDDVDDDDPPMSNEEGELVADIIATGIMTGIVYGVNRKLKKRKPPQQAEPHEKGLAWFHEGASYNLRKIFGDKAKLGPTGKMFCGAAMIVGSMFMNAEPIDGAGAAAAAAQPPAPAPTEATSTNGAPAPKPDETTPETSLAVTGGSPLGTFGVERTGN